MGAERGAARRAPGELAEEVCGGERDFREGLEGDRLAACLRRLRLPGGSGERPDSALSAEALGQRLLRLDDESRIELLENSLEGLER